MKTNYINRMQRDFEGLERATPIQGDNALDEFEKFAIDTYGKNDLSPVELNVLDDYRRWQSKQKPQLLSVEDEELIKMALADKDAVHLQSYIAGYKAALNTERRYTQDEMLMIIERHQNIILKAHMIIEAMQKGEKVDAMIETWKRMQAKA